MAPGCGGLGQLPTLKSGIVQYTLLSVILTSMQDV